MSERTSRLCWGQLERLKPRKEISRIGFSWMKETLYLGLKRHGVYVITTPEDGVPGANPRCFSWESHGTQKYALLAECSKTSLIRTNWARTFVQISLSPRANYTDRSTAACRRSNCQLLRIDGATWSAWRIPTAVFSVSRLELLLFYQVAPQLYSRGWVDPVPDPLLVFFGSAENRTRASGSVAKNSDY
jgi:hypothetical protein